MCSPRQIGYGLRMTDETNSLTEREKQVLRLLAASHDAKSAARHLGLSVHTVNERLRTARRKLGVSSSRAAARQLSQVEQSAPKFLVDEDLGEGAAPAVVKEARPAAHRPRRSRAWVIGGLLVSAAVLTLIHALRPSTPAGPDLPSVPVGIPRPPAPTVRETPMDAIKAPRADAATPAAVPGPPAARPLRAPEAATHGALAWLQLLDRGDWNESWRTASSTFKTRTTQAEWASAARTMRGSIGPLSRVQQYATLSHAPPGSPVGATVVIQYQSTSGEGLRTLETVVLIREGAEWKVSAYFVHGSPERARRPSS